MTSASNRWQASARVLGLAVALLGGTASCQADKDNCRGASCDALAQTSGDETPEPISRFARLTHAQWDNTVSDLFASVELPRYEPMFRSDPTQKGFLFDNDANSLTVDDTLWQAYQQAAQEVATLVAADDDYLATASISTGDLKEQGREFIESVGKQVHRRPLTSDQVEGYLDVFLEGQKVFPELEPFAAGVRLMVQTFLQSPYFLYRVEESAKVVNSVVPLDDYEIAARLSYALWDTMPDTELFAAADAGRLKDPTVVAEQARRLLDSKRAAPVLTRMHDALFDTGRYRGINRYPVEELPYLAEQELHLFVNHVVFDEDGGLADLLTSPETFVNSELAELYGVDGDYGEDFELVELDPKRRAGFLTQIGFLASNANSGTPDPIHRGVLIARKLACVNIPMPPNGIPPLPPADGRTNRETVEAHTESPDSICISCHGQTINPFGFPFEYYDGVGRYRTEDNGHPVDGSTTPTLDGDKVEVSNGVELAHALASSEQVHECYARHLLEFTFGRPTGDLDASLVHRLVASSMQDAAPIKELLVQIVSSRPFLTRNQEEVE